MVFRDRFAGLLLAVGSLLATSGCGTEPPIESAEDLVRAMHARYAGKWYETLTFVQTASFYGEDGTITQDQIWYEAMHVPGRLRIDIAPLENGRTVVYANDSLYRFRDGELANSGPGLNPLLLLGFDVYGQPAERTLEQLETLDFDLSKFRTDEWQDRSVFVVGADAGDEHSAQFWVDQERLLFVRLLQPAGPGGESTQEIQFNEYEPLGGGWIAPEVVFMTDGNLTLREVYRNVRANVDLGAGLFDVETWQAAGWVER